MTPTCTIPTCERPHKGRDLCDMHLQRLRRTGTTDSPVKTLAQRFWEKVDRNGPTLRPDLGPCWLWTGATNEHGYGVMRPTGRRTGPTVKAHRVSAELAGLYVADRMVLHSCDNPPCVKPTHLRPGDAAENADDMVKRGRTARGSRRPQSKLTEDQVVVIRARAAAGEAHRIIAADYGVTRSTISYVTRKGWKHVPPEPAITGEVAA